MTVTSSPVLDYLFPDSPFSILYSASHSSVVHPFHDSTGNHRFVHHAFALQNLPHMFHGQTALFFNPAARLIYSTFLPVSAAARKTVISVLMKTLLQTGNRLRHIIIGNIRAYEPNGFHEIKIRPLANTFGV